MRPTGRAGRVADTDGRGRIPRGCGRWIPPGVGPGRDAGRREHHHANVAEYGKTPQRSGLAREGDSGHDTVAPRNAS
ncbi:hypothetical protein ACWT_6278 [Actinoplanes sp. SE50]|nr:hypothetical protein ACPL_6411 [Actinoplanes sp. SE50/110]ATO85693.1 hypothetical protein ACWT_6278 [Actinoplanes sp. SE50]SLM03106.1 hypothetical protein ACSP50_6395 [Actinoplanes sp. SE50/110]